MSGLPLQLFIINKSGGVVFNMSLSPQAPELTVNDCLRLGSTFHGLHAITQQIAPVKSGGIEKIETDQFRLQCFQSLTGTKFVLTATPGLIEMDHILAQVYELYSDYVLKNPFFEIDMPIRCKLFNKHISSVFKKYEVTPGKKKAGGGN